jgi:hypothetical protein
LAFSQTRIDYFFMPIHLLPSATSRRRFISNVASLASGVILGAGLRPLGLLQGQESLSDSREAWALLSDTHIDGDVATNARGINMADHLRQAVGEVLQAHAQRPFAGLMINGDCAYLEGKSDDYSTLGLSDSARFRTRNPHSSHSR